MSAIPPNWLGSIIQTHAAQNSAAKARKKETTDQARQSEPFQDQLQEVIENTDRDSQIYSDAEGAGSQGRCSEEPEDAAPEQPETPQPEEPTGGLDLTA